MIPASNSFASFLIFSSFSKQTSANSSSWVVSCWIFCSFSSNKSLAPLSSSYLWLFMESLFSLFAPVFLTSWWKRPLDPMHKYTKLFTWNRCCLFKQSIKFWKHYKFQISLLNIFAFPFIHLLVNKLWKLLWDQWINYLLIMYSWTHKHFRRNLYMDTCLLQSQVGTGISRHTFLPMK